MTTVGRVDGVDDGDRVRASLGAWLGQRSWSDLTTDEVTETILDSVVAWGRAQGWRVYRRAPSVLPLPPPHADRRSILDVACARPDGPPIAIEVDRTDRQRTVEKLLAEAAAGRLSIWVRWGVGPFRDPPAPVRLVTCTVTTRRGPAGRGHLHSHSTAADRPAPAHSDHGAGAAEPLALPIHPPERPAG